LSLPFYGLHNHLYMSSYVFEAFRFVIILLQSAPRFFRIPLLSNIFIQCLLSYTASEGDKNSSWQHKLRFHSQLSTDRVEFAVYVAIAMKYASLLVVINVPSLRIHFCLKMEAIYSSEMSVQTRIPRLHSTEDGILSATICIYIYRSRIECICRFLGF
jgi:hypothetical protein